MTFWTRPVWESFGTASSFLLLMWGGFKFAAFEAEAIRPLIENGPFLGWLYGLLGVRGSSALIGMESSFGGFLKKDIILLGAALFTAAEALGAARARGSRDRAER